jgi:hypothetical protein
MQVDQGLQMHRALLLIATLIVGILLPYGWSGEVGPAILRVTGLVLWSGLLLTFLTDLFAAWLARYHGHASLSAYSALLGLLLGNIIGSITLLTVSGSHDLRGSLDPIDYIVILLFQSVAAVLVGSFSFLAAMTGTRLALRLRLAPTLGAVAGYVSVLALYALVGALLFT